MASIDQQFVEYIVKTLVNNPERVAVERKIDEKGVLLSLTVDPADVGRVIGRRGVTAQAIRVLLRALGTKQDARYNLKIVNTDEGQERAGNAPEENSEEPVAEVASAEEMDVVEDDSADEEDTSESAEEDPASELAKKTRAELADYDDLDI